MGRPEVPSAGVFPSSGIVRPARRTVGSASIAVASHVIRRPNPRPAERTLADWHGADVGCEDVIGAGSARGIRQCGNRHRPARAGPRLLDDRHSTPVFAMELRPELMPPALDEAKVLRLAELAAGLDGAHPGSWEEDL